VLANGGLMRARGDDQLASTQTFQRGLDGAFRQTGCVSNSANTCRDRTQSRSARCFPEQIQINKKRSRMLVMADEVSHQDIDDVRVDRNRGFQCKARIRAASRMMKNPTSGSKFLFTVKRTALFRLRTRSSLDAQSRDVLG
jgi:hypothetical protein